MKTSCFFICLLASIQLAAKAQEIVKPKQTITDSLYTNYMFSPRETKHIIRSINIYKDNDIFFPPDYFIKDDRHKFNQDRNYTGGGKFKIPTDYYAFHIFGFWKDTNTSSYRSISAGLQAYTSYVRLDKLKQNCPNHYKQIIDNNFTDSLDRPWASFQYISGSIYRKHNRLPIKLVSQYKIGTIGGKISNSFQTAIHKTDVSTSKSAYGWEHQIANGGRLVWNIDHKLEFMLWSVEGSIFDTKKLKHSKKAFNLGASLESHIGMELTAWGAGLSLSNQTIIRQSQITRYRPSFFRNGRFIQRKSKKFTAKVNWLYKLDYRIRYVQHNSMLEGCGIFNSFANENHTDGYVLQKDQVNRLVYLLNLKLGLKRNRLTLYFTQSFISPEFEIRDERKQYLDKYIESKLPGNWYMWGRIGITVDI